MQAPRYAIYLAPEPDTPLWALGSALIGYDAARGHEVAFPKTLMSQSDRWHALTEDPRRYGFHLTLKAPFRLAEGCTIMALERELETFARHHAGFDIGPLRLECPMSREGNGFVCLVPRTPSPDLLALERAVVTAFDRFRAPLTPGETERRKPELLSEKQRGYLAQFGYPFVLDEFRPHFSLTGSHSDPHQTAEHLSIVIADLIGSAEFFCRSLALFEQDTPVSRFKLRRTFGLTGRKIEE